MKKHLCIKPYVISEHAAHGHGDRSQNNFWQPHFQRGDWIGLYQSQAKPENDPRPVARESLKAFPFSLLSFESSVTCIYFSLHEY